VKPDYYTALYMMGWSSIAKRFEIIPGVVVRKLQEQESARYGRSAGPDHNPHFNANYMVEVYADKYLEALRERVEEKNRNHVTSENLKGEIMPLLMQTGMSLHLVTGNFFCFYHSITKVRTDNVAHTISVSFPVRLPRPHITGAIRDPQITVDSLDRKTRRKISAIAFRIDPIYRVGLFSNCTLSLALAHFSNALYSNFQTECFLSLCTCVEALLNSKGTEVSHTVCERLALCLSSDPDERHAIYGEMKKIYGIRSDIVHGNFRNLKKRITRRDMFIHARDPVWCLVPSERLGKLYEFASSLLELFIMQEELYELSMNHSGDAARMNDYFKRLIFS